MADIRALLHEAAAAPERPVSVPDLLARARRRGWRRWVAWGAGISTVIGVAVPAETLLAHAGHGSTRVATVRRPGGPQVREDQTGHSTVPPVVDRRSSAPIGARAAATGTFAPLPARAPGGQPVAAGAAPTGGAAAPGGGASGSRIAYVASDGVHVVNANGTNDKRIDGGSQPAWSADGSHIVYQRAHASNGNGGCNDGPSTFGGGPCEIWIANADGSGRHFVMVGSDPSWSPDGRRIAFAFNTTTSTVNGPGGIWVANTDGSSRVLLTPSGWAPAWSPDGARIAFDRTDTTGSPGGSTSTEDLYVMNPDGSNITKVTAGANAAWSPDGSKLAFSAFSAPGDNIELYTVDLASGSVIPMTYDTAGANSMSNTDLYPSWSPDGRHIIFAHDPDGPTGLPNVCYINGGDGSVACGVGGPMPPQLVMIDADGSGRTTLRQGDMPAFSPR